MVNALLPWLHPPKPYGDQILSSWPTLVEVLKGLLTSRFMTKLSNEHDSINTLKTF